jgi:hypothetical protein
MECEKCQELLSEFLDGGLESEHHARVDEHLADCLPCFGVRRELESIANVCRECQGNYDALPNERAMWLRICNTIESEQQAVTRGAARAASNAQAESWWSRVTNRSWQLSLPQLATAVAAITIAVSLSTAIGVRHVQNLPQGDPILAAADNTGAYQVANNSSGDARNGLIMNASATTDMRPQQMTIEYWKDRTEKRMTRWNPQTRAAFLRNMQVIDQALQEAAAELRRNPHDEVSEEMLNAALNDKVELLKEFSDL